MREGGDMNISLDFLKDGVWDKNEFEGTEALNIEVVSNWNIGERNQQWLRRLSVQEALRTGFLNWIEPIPSRSNVFAAYLSFI